jgi:hypothetical protein
VAVSTRRCSEFRIKAQGSALGPSEGRVLTGSVNRFQGRTDWAEGTEPAAELPFKPDRATVKRRSVTDTPG